jgi:hypothetical protein
MAARLLLRNAGRLGGAFAGSAVLFANDFGASSVACANNESSAESRIKALEQRLAALDAVTKKPTGRYDETPMPMSADAASELSRYPTPAEVDAFCENLIADAANMKFTATKLPDPSGRIDVTVEGTWQPPAQYVEFELEDGSSFYCYWQPAPGEGRKPTLVNTPGYAGAVQSHPTMAATGFNILHINPLAYAGPDGVDMRKRVEISPGAERLFVASGNSTSETMLKLYPKVNLPCNEHAARRAPHKACC